MPIRQRDRDAENGPNGKKQRLDFGKGSITRLSVKNFMTYSHAEFKPGSRLNLVLGPNGAGKSSLVSAICLGLAGSPKLLARADNLRDFVLRGKATGQIDIWLSTGESRDKRITRTLNRESNSSEWKLDGRPALLRDVQLLVEDLGIQLDNLCQFMPQDRVAEFARLKPKELLEETEKAIGQAELYNQHQELIEERKEFAILETAVGTHQSELERLEKVNESLKRDVSRFEHKAELEAQIQELRGRARWLEYETKKAQIADSKDTLERAERGLKSAVERQNQSSGPQKEKQKRMQAAEKKAKKAKAMLDQARKDADSAQESITDLVEEIEAKQEEIEGADAEYEKLQKDIKTLGEKVKKAEEALKKHDSVGPEKETQEHSDELKTLRNMKKDAAQNVVAWDAQVTQKQNETANFQREIDQDTRRLNAFKDVKVQKLASLEDQYKGITSFTAWLNTPETKSMFQGNVYGPILTEVTVENPEHAKLLELHCPRQVWSRFVCEYSKDQDLLVEESRHSGRWKGFKPAVTTYTGNVNAAVSYPLGEASQYAGEHITHTLDQVFTAPNIIKLMLCDEVGVNTAYCGNGALNPMKFMENHPNIKRVMTPDSSYSNRTSKYNPAAKSTSVLPVRQSNLLRPSNSAQEDEERGNLEARVQDLVQKCSAARAEQGALEKQVREERQREKDLENKIKAVQNKANEAKMKRSKLSKDLSTLQVQLQKKQEAADPRDQIPMQQAEIETFKQNLAAKMEELVESYKELLGFKKDYIINAATQKELSFQIDMLGKARTDADRKVKEYTDGIKKIKGYIEREVAEMQECKQEAEGITGKLTAQLKEKLNKLPNEDNEIRNLISEKESEINAIHLANPQAVRQYQERQQEIQKLQDLVKHKGGNAERMRKRIEDKMNAWLPELRRNVQQINERFQDCFRKIGCVGEVLLHEEQSLTSALWDFERFAIHIRVKYRESESLQLLDQHRQSGGERSVATILYLISLQNVTVTPFRVVDEINQGMDPINERKCFMQLVEASCQPNTPQCFLLTPKLLPNLPYSEFITLLQINNGSTIRDVARNFEKAQLIGSRVPIAAC